MRRLSMSGWKPHAAERLSGPGVLRWALYRCGVLPWLYHKQHFVVVNHQHKHLHDNYHIDIDNQQQYEYN